MKSLNLTFKTNKGKKHLLKLGYANSNLDAKYVDTVDTVLFNDATEK